jgi:glycerol dehydrogenase-like iron-containing ADH family enzyme
LGLPIIFVPTIASNDSPASCLIVVYDDQHRIAEVKTRGLTAQTQAQGALHGELVAWGLLAQLIAEGHEAAFVDEIITFYNAIGLPVCLADLGFEEISPHVIDEIAETTWREAPYVKNMVRAMSADQIAGCIQDFENSPVNRDDTASWLGTRRGRK